MSIQQLITDNPAATDAQILALRHAEPVIYRRVPIAVVNQFLIDRFLNGRLRLARDNEAMPIQVRAFLGDFLMGIQLAQSFDGTSETIRGATSQALGALVQAQVMTQEESDAFQSLMVSENPAADTLDDVSAARSQLARAALHQQWATVHNTVAAGIDDGTLTTLDAVLAKVDEVAAQ